jgi:hypothetical protein
VEAPTGWRLGEVDVNAYHVVMMGGLAQDPNYIRFANLDPHSIAASWMLAEDGKPFEAISLKWSDADIRTATKAYRKRKDVVGRAADGSAMEFSDFRSKISKVFVLGNQLGLQPREAYRKNRRYIPSLRDAERYKAVIDGGFPLVTAYKVKLTDMAHEQGYLQNVYGRVHPFYAVKEWRKQRNGAWEEVAGSQYNEALAFMVQSSAFDHKLELMLKWVISGIEGVPKYNPETCKFVNDVHDAWVVIAPEDGEEGVQEQVRRIHAVMTTPSEVFRVDGVGLRVRATAELGKNWARQTEENLEGMLEVEV